MYKYALPFLIHVNFYISCLLSCNLLSTRGTNHIFVSTYVGSWEVMLAILKEYSVKWHLFTIKIGTQQGVFKDTYLHMNFVTYSMQYKLL